MFVTFDDWTQNRSIRSFGTNAGAAELPFQTWKSFKEAYPPELVARAISESAIAVETCLDPFGGSGTTALACQFLGVRPTIIEVNPFLADLIEAKLARYDTDALARDLGDVARNLAETGADTPEELVDLPPTFVEPGVNNRWIFDQKIFSRISALLTAIEPLRDSRHRRLFSVLLGGILLSVSNVVISGKGRRYRSAWRDRKLPPTCVDDAFFRAARNAVADIHRFSNRLQRSYEVICGDSRASLNAGAWDIAVFSPPYPNSFDYTDVYNIELWMLGYLRNFDENRALRQTTLTSHVQISRPLTQRPQGSALLDITMGRLTDARCSLWDRRIPEMVAAYFADLLSVMDGIRGRLRPGGSTWFVVGDSRYAGVQIATANIMAELMGASGWRIKSLEPFRSMRYSAQQGGHPKLAETLIVAEPQVRSLFGPKLSGVLRRIDR